MRSEALDNVHELSQPPRRARVRPWRAALDVSSSLSCAKSLDLRHVKDLIGLGYADIRQLVSNTLTSGPTRACGSGFYLAGIDRQVSRLLALENAADINARRCVIPMRMSEKATALVQQAVASDHIACMEHAT